MISGTWRLTGVIGGVTAGMPFAMLALPHGTIGLIMGGLVVIATASIGRRTVDRTFTKRDGIATVSPPEADQFTCQLSITTQHWRLTVSNRRDQLP